MSEKPEIRGLDLLGAECKCPMAPHLHRHTDGTCPEPTAVADQSGGQRAADNRQRAADLAWTVQEHDNLGRAEARIRDALDAAEARGYERGRDEGLSEGRGDMERLEREWVARGRAYAVRVLRAAAAAQRNEADNVPDTDEGTHAGGHRCAADFLDMRADGLVAASDTGSGTGDET